MVSLGAVSITEEESRRRQQQADDYYNQIRQKAEGLGLDYNHYAGDLQRNSFLDVDNGTNAFNSIWDQLDKRAQSTGGGDSGTGLSASGGYGGGNGFSSPKNAFKPVNYDPYKYNFSNLPAPNFSQYQRPDYSSVENPSQQLVQQLVTNPHTLPPQAIAAMKEKQKEEALLMQQQLTPGVQQLQNNGMVGAANALQQRYAGDLVSGLTSAYRDTDLAAIERNRQDELAAVQMANGFLTDSTNRNINTYNTELGGQQSQYEALLRQAALEDARQQMMAGENQFSANFQLQNNLAESDSYGQLLAQELAQAQFSELIRQFNAREANNLTLAGWQTGQVRPTGR